MRRTSAVGLVLLALALGLLGAGCLDGTETTATAADKDRIRTVGPTFIPPKQ